MAEPYNQNTALGPGFARDMVPDYRQAEADLLRHFADRLDRGENGTDFGAELIALARIIARRI